MLKLRPIHNTTTLRKNPTWSHSISISNPSSSWYTKKYAQIQAAAGSWRCCNYNIPPVAWWPRRFPSTRHGIMLLATAAKLFISAWYTSGFRSCALCGLNELDRAASSMDFRFEDPFIIIPGNTEEVWLWNGGGLEGAWCSRPSDDRGRKRRGNTGDESREGRGLEALEETKGVFSPRWNGRTFLPLLERAAT